MTTFIPGGPKRYAHQMRGLKKLIETSGIGALLFDPGLGKTAVALDFSSILALKALPVDGVQEVRVLVVAPLAAVDTWVKQSALWVSPQVNIWAEAIGGEMTRLERAYALASRGGQPMLADMLRHAVKGYDFTDDKSRMRAFRRGIGVLNQFSVPTDERGIYYTALVKKARADQKAWTFQVDSPWAIRPLNQTSTEVLHKEIQTAEKFMAPKPVLTAPRAYGVHDAIDWYARADGRDVLISRSEGPEGLGTAKPRLILEVINFDTLSSRERVGSNLMSDVILAGIKRYKPDLVIVDESHKIKGVSSHISTMMDRIGQTVKRRIILTGTVMPAGPLDVFAQWRFLDPYEFGDPQPDGSVRRSTFASFEARFAVKAPIYGPMGPQKVTGYRNIDELQTRMGRRATVARKQDELDLPPVIPMIVPVMLSPAEKQAYQEMKKGLATQFVGGGSVMAASKLTQMLRLRQITAGHLPDDKGVIRDIGFSKVNTVRSIAFDQLPEEKRIVIFCLFRHEFETLVKRLQSGPTERATVVLGINGDTPNNERIAIRQRFGVSAKDDPTRMILVAQIKTLSLAVNELVTAQNVIFASLSQERDDLIQAIDRLNRIGQVGASVNVYFVEAPRTIDTVIHKSHDNRTDLEAAVLRHILGDDDNELPEAGFVQGVMPTPLAREVRDDEDLPPAALKPGVDLSEEELMEINAKRIKRAAVV